MNKIQLFSRPPPPSQLEFSGYAPSTPFVNGVRLTEREMSYKTE